ncbi:hypothetical protein MJT46_009424 [Ovis ammon polii x Ovis aries]|nr:hypothetical protein MJT46_009424 [Ovis ammon polii x Ovis aries]
MAAKGMKGKGEYGRVLKYGGDLIIQHSSVETYSVSQGKASPATKLASAKPSGRQKTTDLIFKTRKGIASQVSQLSVILRPLIHAPAYIRPEIQDTQSLSYAVRHERIDNDDGNSAFPTESNYDTSCLTFWWKQDESLGNLIIMLPVCASVSKPDLKTEATD